MGGGCALAAPGFSKQSNTASYPSVHSVCSTVARLRGDTKKVNLSIIKTLTIRLSSLTILYAEHTYILCTWDAKIQGFNCRENVVLFHSGHHQILSSELQFMPSLLNDRVCFSDLPLKTETYSDCFYSYLT